MKKYFRGILIILFSTLVMLSCNEDDASKGYAASIKDKTWWGTLTYTGEAAQYYSVHFNGDNTLVWSQLSGDYPGEWNLKGKSLTLHFTGSSVEIKTDISDDNTLETITDTTPSYEINNGHLLVSENIPLENTVWSGFRVYGSTKPLKLTFISDSKVEIKVDNSLYGGYSYWDFTRPASGGFIRITGLTHICVFTSDTELKGSELTVDKVWQATKQ